LYLRACIDSLRRSLTRSNHTITIVNDKAYLFGGETADGELASNDIHIVNLAPEKNKEPEYQLIPALACGDKVPLSRMRHTACAFRNGVVIYGGVSSTDQPADPGEIWFFSPESLAWETLYSPSSPTSCSETPSAGSQVRVFSHDDSLVICSESRDSGKMALWKYSPAEPDVDAKPWPVLAPPPTPVSPSNLALHGTHLYYISSSEPVSSQLHILPLSPTKSGEDAKWTSLAFPTNPIIPGPRARHGGALLPVSTGYGRNYLIYLLGARSQHTATFGQGTSSFVEQNLTSNFDKNAADDKKELPVLKWSDTWALQLPSSNLEPQAKLSVTQAIKPAKIKDAVRSAVGADSGKWSWSEVEVCVPDDLGHSVQGKLHPGPRAFFGADVMEDKKNIVFWGGECPQGGKVGDGWVVRFE